MISRRLSLSIQSKPRSLNAIRKELQNFIADTPYEDREMDILVVVSEACTNVVRHAYSRSHERKVIAVEGVMKPDILTITVRDEGKGLVMSSSTPLFSEKGGFGIFLMRRLADSFKCDALPGFGTVVKLSFRNPHAKPRWQRSKKGTHVNRGFVPASWFALRPKVHGKALMTAICLRLKIGDLRESIRNDQPELSRQLVHDIEKHIGTVRQDFADKPIKQKSLLMRHLKNAHRSLSQLGQELTDETNEGIPNTKGIPVLSIKGEVALLVSQVSEQLVDLINGNSECLISLGDKPMRLI